MNLYNLPVSAFRRLQRHLVLVALLAMSALALLPTVSRAMALGGLTQGGVSWTPAMSELCTAEGMQRITAVSTVSTVAESGWVGSGDARGDLPGMVDHCPLCTLAHDEFALLQGPYAAVDLSRFIDEEPSGFLRASHTLFAWRSSQPRAPPALI